MAILLFFSGLTEDLHASETNLLTPTTLLKCMNKKTKLLRSSTVIKNCKKSELSLGATAILHPLIRPDSLDPQVLTRFIAAKAAAKKVGFDISITSGFRSLASQKILFDKAISKYGSVEEASKWVAPPLVSHHPWGIAIDVNYPSGPKGAGWLELHGWKFGLCRVFKNEWWHFEPTVAPGRKCAKLVPDATHSLP